MSIRHSSPSRIAADVGSLAKAPTMLGNRSVYSAPCREYSRTWLPSLMTWKRKPSHLGSCSQSSPLGWADSCRGGEGTDEGETWHREAARYSTTGATQTATAGLGCFDVPPAFRRAFLRNVKPQEVPCFTGFLARQQAGRRCGKYSRPKRKPKPMMDPLPLMRVEPGYNRCWVGWPDRSRPAHSLSPDAPSHF